MYFSPQAERGLYCQIVIDENDLAKSIGQIMSDVRKKAGDSETVCITIPGCFSELTMSCRSLEKYALPFLAAERA